MDKTEGDIERGHQAETLLNSTLFREVLNGLDEIYTAAWRASKTLEAREDCYRYTQLIERLVQDVTTIATTGKLARLRIEELERGKKRVLTWPKM